MPINVTFNGVNYSIPVNDEPMGTWAVSLTNFLVAVGNNALTRGGGTFNLTSDLNLGANYGLITKYVKSISANIAHAGIIRLANNETVAWRNAGNTADVALKVNADDKLEFDGAAVSAAELGHLSGVTDPLQTQVDNKQPLDADLTAVAGLATTGLVARTGSGTAETRTITGTAGRITVTDGDGINGNPTLDIGADVATKDGTETLTNKIIDGDNNTLSDIALTSLKVDAPNANKLLSRDGSGAVVASKAAPTGDVVGTSDTQTLTNKTLDTPTLENHSVLKTAAVPAGTPAAGEVWLFANDTNDKLYRKDSAGAIHEVGSGGSGDVNGPATSVANKIPVFADTTGKILKEAPVALPVADGGAGQILATDGSGALEWTDYPIVNGSAAIANNQSVATNIPGFSLGDGSTWTGAVATYSFTRYRPFSYTALTLPTFNSPVYAMAEQADGKVLIGGLFTNPSNRIARANIDGTLDAAFMTNIGTGFNGLVRAILVTDGGKIICGGDFTTFNGASAPYLFALNEDGTPWTTFNTNIGTGPNAAVRCFAYDPLAFKVFIGGDFTALNGWSGTKGVACVQGYDGTNSGFNVGTGVASGSVNALACHNLSGSLFVGGTFTNFNSNPINRLVGLDYSGSFLGTFNGGIGTAAPATVSALALNPTTGILYVGGQFTTFNAVTRGRIVALNVSTGSATNTQMTNIGVGADNHVSALAFDPSEQRLFVGGPFNNFAGTSRIRFVCLDSTGLASFTGLNTATSNNWVSGISMILATSSGKFYANQSYTGGYAYLNGFYTREQHSSVMTVQNIHVSNPVGTLWSTTTLGSVGSLSAPDAVSFDSATGQYKYTSKDLPEATVSKIRFTITKT